LLAQIFLAWSEFMLGMEDENIALVDLKSEKVQKSSGINQLRALGTLDPESLLDCGLETWVRGVMEPPESSAIVPKLRNLSDLRDPVNLPYVRMIVRDAKVSRARSNLAPILSRTLAHIEISYLDQEIERTNRDLREIASGTRSDYPDEEDLQARLRKLSSERVRRYQKFILRVSP
jgi:hypothetical protein